MERALIDRWTDTPAFRLMLFLSSCAVLPVLALGALTTVMWGAAALIDRSDIALEQAAFGFLSLGGSLGFVGYLRAHFGVRDPRRHNVTATLLCLAAGIAAALVVAGFVAVQAVATWLTPWGQDGWIGVAALFATANIVWVLAGVAWMRRVLRSFAERTGSAFDGLPVVLLLVAAALATAATLAMSAL